MPCSVRKQILKGDNGVRPPKILGKHRKDLEFVNAALAKNLKIIDLRGVTLETDSKKKIKIKRS